MSKFLRYCVLLVCVLHLTACASTSATDDPTTVVKDYLQARVDGDADQVRNLVCAEQDSQAANQALSLAAVDASLEGVECTVDGIDGAFTRVTCQGSFVFNYDGEILERPIGNWQTIQEEGAWRVCGEAAR